MSLMGEILFVNTGLVFGSISGGNCLGTNGGSVGADLLGDSLLIGDGVIPRWCALSLKCAPSPPSPGCAPFPPRPKCAFLLFPTPWAVATLCFVAYANPPRNCNSTLLWQTFGKPAVILLSTLSGNHHEYNMGYLV